MRRTIAIAVLLAVTHHTASFAQNARHLGPLKRRLDIHNSGFNAITCVGTCYGRRPQSIEHLCQGDYGALNCSLSCDRGQPKIVCR
jgi:hypothetical protein